jgi:hypothetical protein
MGEGDRRQELQECWSSFRVAYFVSEVTAESIPWAKEGERLKASVNPYKLR